MARMINSQSHSDASNGPPSVPGPVILFDGECNLCDASVQFIIERDRNKAFYFASLQSAFAQRLLQHESVIAPWPDSIILIDEQGVHVRSDAAICIASRLSHPWPLLRWARLLPLAVRDSLYSWIARNRYRWFGRRSECKVPSPSLRARFLDADENLPPVANP